MREFNLQNEVNNLLLELDSVDYSDVKSILEWFYKCIEYNSIFENIAISEYVYTKLANYNYRETINFKEELETFNILLNSKGNEDPERVGKCIISQIMTCIKNHISFDMRLIFLIQIYNGTFNKEFTTTYMMNNLKNNIGNEIVYVGYKDGKRFFKTGILKNVESYKSIDVVELTNESLRIPFIGYKTAMVSIHSKEGFSLYNNRLIKENYNLQDFKEIEKLNIETFGTNYNEIIKKGII